MFVCLFVCDLAIYLSIQTLAPLILRGVAGAVAQLCSRVDRMVYTSKAAYVYGSEKRDAKDGGGAGAD